VIDFLCKRQR